MRLVWRTPFFSEICKAYLKSSPGILELTGFVAIVTAKQVVNFALLDVVRQTGHEQRFHLLLRRRHFETTFTAPSKENKTKDRGKEETTNKPFCEKKHAHIAM
jgi:hypothetical protein